MKIACFSDLHGQIPRFIDCDLAVVAGDILPDGTWMEQWRFFNGKFFPWITQFTNAFFIAGNHDLLLSQSRHLLPAFGYLEDEMGIFNHLKVWGTPWTRTYGRGWAFMEDEEALSRRFANIPACDILVTHGPPKYYGDPGRPECEDCPMPNAGSAAMLYTVARIQPKLVVCGHLHDGYGIYQYGRSIIVNAALSANTRDKGLVNEPILVEI